jgi:hypothetical protein
MKNLRSRLLRVTRLVWEPVAMIDREPLRHIVGCVSAETPLAGILASNCCCRNQSCEVCCTPYTRAQSVTAPSLLMMCMILDAKFYSIRCGVVC